MARGRMITNAICGDKKVNGLSDDTCRLLFTWLVTFADRDGRVRGDAAMVRSTVFPRRTDIEIEQVEKYLQELHDAGLIIRYEAADDTYIWFVKFDKNQPGLRKDREPDSELPPPPSAAVEEYVRKFSVINPAEFRQSSGLREEKRREENGMEVKGDAAATPPISGDWYMRVFSSVTGMASIPGNEVDKAIAALDGLYAQHRRNEAALTEYLRPYWDKWLTTKGKNGQPYKRTNCAWLYEWAVAGELPGDTPKPQYAEVF